MPATHATRPRLLPLRSVEPPFDDDRDWKSDRPWRRMATAHAVVGTPGPDPEEPIDSAAGRQAPLPLAFPTRRLPPVTVYSPLRHLAAPPETAGGGPTVARTAGQHGELGLSLAWRATPRSELCDPVPWARQLARGVAEVLVGARPPRQLSAWLTEDAHAQLRRATWRRRVRNRDGGPRPARGQERRPRILVRSVHVAEPADGVAEVSVHLWIDGRGTAAALRAEGRDGRWRCTAIDLG